MTQKTSKSLAAVPALFSDVHPALAALESAVTKFKPIVSRADSSNKKTTKLLLELTSGDWFGSLEDSSANHNETMRAHARFEEKSLAFLSATLAAKTSHQAVVESRAHLRQTIADALIAHDALVEDSWLRPVFKTR